MGYIAHWLEHRKISVSPWKRSNNIINFQGTSKVPLKETDIVKEGFVQLCLGVYQICIIIF